MADQSAEDAFLASLQEGATGEAEDASESDAPATDQSSHPRTIGGFIVDDDDEDDDDDDGSNGPQPIPPNSNALLNVDSGTPPSRSSVHSPNNAAAAVSSSDAPVPFLPANEDRPRSAIDGITNIASPPAFPSAGDSTLSAHEASRGALQPSQSVEYDASAVETDPDMAIASTGRLPTDRLGFLEDRIAEDPRGDVDAWLSLINEYKRRNKIEQVRETYEKFFKVFPSSADEWIAYVTWELDNQANYKVEQTFRDILYKIPSITLWQTYLDYVRRRYNLMTDTTGDARRIVSQVFEHVLDKMGQDKDAGPMWQEYIQFIKTGPGQVGGTGWQDQQKVDTLRKNFQRAVCVPTAAITALWKDYDTFEMGLNKTNGRKFLQEKSPSYITARSSWMQLQNIVKDLATTTIPKLPPALGFDGDMEYVKQVQIWQNWIAWEKDDPLVIKAEDAGAFRNRVLHVYRCSLIPLRFWPEMWYDAAQFCFDNSLFEQGDEFLKEGASANPESCLLAFRRGDRLEQIKPEKGDEEQKSKEHGATVREPYDNLIKALYILIQKTKERESRAVQALEAEPLNIIFPPSDETLEEEEQRAMEESARKAAQELRKQQVEAVKKGHVAQLDLLKQTITSAWIALMRAMRRIQGKGKGVANDPMAGMRGIFVEARKAGSLTSEVYIQNALMEHYCYQDPTALRIFERGMKLFKEDERFIMEYLKHLIAINDITNARATFQTTVGYLTNKPETMHIARNLYAFFYDFETGFGELPKIQELGKRISELFPEDPQLKMFARRFSSPIFDPIAVRLIVSPATQARPKPPVTIEAPQPLPPAPAPVQQSPQPSTAVLQQVANSPKRPLDDSDNEGPARKLARAGESPLKGAAGRRMHAQKQSTALRNEIGGTPGSSVPMAMPPSLPPIINFLLSIIPRADLYNATVFDADRMVELLRNADLSRANLDSKPFSQAPPPIAPPAHQPSYGYQPSSMNYMR